ncbi:MAG: sulfite exporter TauE/SafE family protein [Bacteroidota bacterium]
MEIAGYLASLFIGVLLGLIGGGGSILTLPVLVYLFEVPPTQATAYSLFIVGTASLVGAWPKHRDGLIDMRTAIVFGIPSIAAVFITRAFLLPALPTTLFAIGSLVVTKNIFLMTLFAGLMLAVSVSMLRGGSAAEKEDECERHFNYPLILLEGAVVGVLTGMVGAGGGFLIIPALVVLSKLPMKKAIATSLLIIAAKSLIGFTGDLMGDHPMNWTLLLSVTAIAVIGIFVGNTFSRRVEGNNLKKAFGWFVLIMGSYILLREFGILPG